jgi:hypothetical protein
VAPKSITHSQARAGLAKIDAELRAQLTPIEIGLKLRQAKVYYEALHPETRASQNAGGGTKKTDPFVRERAQRTRKSESWVQQHIKIVEDIPSDLHDMLNKSSIKDFWTTLYKLSCQRPNEKLRRIAQLVIEGLGYKAAVRQAEDEFTDGVEPVEPVVGQRVHLHPESWERVTIEPGTVDAIISDIDWSRGTIDKLAQFVAFCHRVLKSRGRVVLQTGQATASRVEAAFRERFHYQWTLAYETYRTSMPPWLKGGRSGWTPVLVFGKGSIPWPYNCPDVIREEDDPRDIGNTGHPFVKGVDAYTWLVGELTPEGGLVLDPFMGSGTTGVAAIIMGRKFTGLEPKRRWFKEAKEQLDTAVEAREIREADEAEERATLATSRTRRAAPPKRRRAASRRRRPTG